MSDDRLDDYLRARGNVQVPSDLLERAVRAHRGESAVPPSRSVGWLPVATALVLVVFVGSIVLNSPDRAPVASALPSNAAVVPSSTSLHSATPLPSPSPVSTASAMVGEPFPASVLGMPVVTVAEAAQLATAGRLDGRDVAVAGWFFELMPSCPYPGRYVADLEGFCHFVLFTDTEGAADACDETSCSWNGNGPLTPFILSDTLGDWRELSQPVPMVAIGHAGDARALHCTPDDEAACADQFVVDRVAWAGDKLLDATPKSFAYPGYEGLTMSLTLADISTLLGGSEQVVSAVAVTADGVRSFDPRWNSVGSQPQWIVRSVPSGSDASDVARPVTVWLIDDASGRVVDSQPETLTRQDSGRLWLTQTVHNGDENGSDVRAFYDVIGPDGVAVVWDGPMASSFGYKGSRTFGPDIPVLVPPGDYTLRAWLERFDRQTGDPIANEQPIGTCSTQLSVEAGDDVMFNAAYRSAPCIWSSTTAELTFGYP